MIKFRHILIGSLLTAQAAFAETIYVTNVNDSGAGSLRQAINSANADPTSTTILFNIPGTSGAERIINVPTALPAFTSPVEIRNAGTQTGRTVLKAPIINGPGAATTGMTFNTNSANSKVENITFRDFVFSIVLNTSSVSVLNNRFENNQGGIDVRVNNGGNTIKGNSFTTNHPGAYAISGIGGGNTIQGNGFTKEGINLGAGGNTIGGTGHADPNTFTNISGDAIVISNGSGSIIRRNTISGASGAGINLSGTDMTIEHNNISQVTGWDIIVSGNHSNKINFNQVMGDNGVFNGILVQDGLSYTLNNNWVTGGSIELRSMGGSSWYGQLRVTNNTIVNDPNGFSGHGALHLENTTSAQILNNTIHNNAGNGIFLYLSNNNSIIANTIYENFRTGVNANSTTGNKISRNIIQNNHADVNGGRTGISASAKSAPVISSVKRVGNNFVISGTGTAANDSLEFFASDRQSRNSTLVQNANQYVASVRTSGSSWSAAIPVGTLTGEVYFIATATNTSNTTSSFSRAVGAEINGPTAATTNHTSYYYAEFIPGVSYSWWTSLPIYSQTVSGNSVAFNFMQPGSGTVSVGYTDPATGQWKQYNLAVTVYGPARMGEVSADQMVLPSPNPFTTTTSLTLDGSKGEGVSVAVYNSLGTEELNFAGNHGETVEFGAELIPGVYTVKMVSGGEIKTARIVKQD
ncbi:MAG: right-handed parallel beta-helix repeat-containing protein [Cytophagaceae bacterium]